MPLTLAASSLPVGMGLSRVPFVCQAPKPFLPCEMNIAGKAEPKGTAVVVESPRVKTAMRRTVRQRFWACASYSETRGTKLGSEL